MVLGIEAVKHTQVKLKTDKVLNQFDDLNKRFEINIILGKIKKYKRWNYNF